jgi:hypothetical protein
MRARFGRCEIVISPNRLGAKPLSGHFRDRTTPVVGPVCSRYNPQN